MKKLLAFLLLATTLLADSSGPLAGTATGVSWTNPTNVTASDGVFATCAMAASDICGTLSVSTLGFTLPTGATVTGIAVTFTHKCSGAGCSTATPDGDILLTGCSGTSANRGDSIPWTTVNTATTMGSSSDLWSLTCTVAQINANTFGVQTDVANANTISARSASIDYIAVTVYYTPAGAGSHRRVVISQTRTARAQHA